MVVQVQQLVEAGLTVPSGSQINFKGNRIELVIWVEVPSEFLESLIAREEKHTDEDLSDIEVELVEGAQDTDSRQAVEEA